VRQLWNLIFAPAAKQQWLLQTFIPFRLKKKKIENDSQPFSVKMVSSFRKDERNFHFTNVFSLLVVAAAAIVSEATSGDSLLFHRRADNWRVVPIHHITADELCKKLHYSQSASPARTSLLLSILPSLHHTQQRIISVIFNGTLRAGIRCVIEGLFASSTRRRCSSSI
jgi:hypothetical protein